MEARCPACLATLSSDDINVGEGVAYCRACESIYRLSEVAEATEAAEFDIKATPRGCAIQDNGVETVVSASARSVATAVGLLFAAGFGNSIVSIFVIVNAAATIHHLFGSVPAWFPAPNISKPFPFGMTIFLWIFLAPFIVIGLVLIVAMLNALFGRVVARIRDTDVLIRSGFGPFVRKQRVDATQIKGVREGTASVRWNKQHANPAIEIEADETVTFGAALPRIRKAWMAAALRQLLVFERRR